MSSPQPPRPRPTPIPTPTSDAVATDAPSAGDSDVLAAPQPRRRRLNPLRRRRRAAGSVEGAEHEGWDDEYDDYEDEYDDDLEDEYDDGYDDDDELYEDDEYDDGYEDDDYEDDDDAPATDDPTTPSRRRRRRRLLPRGRRRGTAPSEPVHAGAAQLDVDQPVGEHTDEPAVGGSVPRQADPDGPESPDDEQAGGKPRRRVLVGGRSGGLRTGRTARPTGPSRNRPRRARPGAGVRQGAGRRLTRARTGVSGAGRRVGTGVGRGWRGTRSGVRHGAHFVRTHWGRAAYLYLAFVGAALLVTLLLYWHSGFTYDECNSCGIPFLLSVSPWWLLVLPFNLATWPLLLPVAILILFAGLNAELINRYSKRPQPVYTDWD